MRLLVEVVALLARCVDRVGSSLLVAVVERSVDVNICGWPLVET